MKTSTSVTYLLILASLSALAAPMMTTWGEKVTSENAWRDYPRPQMVRENWTCLNGDWDYQITSITNTMAHPAEWAGKIRVPFSLEAPLSGCGGRQLQPDEYLWYTRELQLDPKPGERILLHFGAVDFRAIVYLGHDEVAIHEGGNLPFTIDLTPFAPKGTNTLTVLVWDPTEEHFQPKGKQCKKTRGCFYTQVSGIWQTVWMETVPEAHIADYDVTADIDKGTVTLTFRGTGNGERGTVEILCDSATLREKFIPGESVTIKLPAPIALWSPETPNLYNFTARYGKDEIKGYFAMRRFEKKKDANGILRFFLNNEPYYVMGTLDQGWWPDGLLTPPSEEAMAFDIKTLKECGFNTMRKHIKVEPLRYYALCDKMGMLVLQDMPCGIGGSRSPMHWKTTKSYSLYRTELKGMINLLKKVPSIVMWVPYNEGWGQHDRILTHTTLDFVRRYDSTRLVCGPSGAWDWEGGNLLPQGWDWDKRVFTGHLPEGECEASDVVDMHVYRGPAMFDVNPRRVSFLGEFGGLGHPVEGHVWREYDQGKVLGENYGASWGYGGIDDTKTPEGLETVYLGLIEKLGKLAKNGLGGSIYTQTTDVELEINGLMTYDRKVLKFNSDELRRAHEKVIEDAKKAATETMPRNVPDLMKNQDGTIVATAADWEEKRALEILDTYRREVFGARPPSLDDRSRVSFRIADERETFGGKAVRKTVIVNYAGERKDFSFPFTVFIPKSGRKVPAFVYIGLHIKTSFAEDGEFRSHRWPVEDIIDRGYATACFCNTNVAADAKTGFDQGIFAAVESPAERCGASWGTISAWAWAASRVMDWMETENAIDAAHVGVVGHSRGGKTAIWAGANDRRFAMICSTDSGCSGAKLNHIDLPRSESIARITRGFPYWFCENYRKYAGREMEMPFDQHELLALVAPRLLCVASATEDSWAGPAGEWWAAKLASPAWELYGRKGLVAKAPPAPDSPQQDGCISYHLRTGRHTLAPYDWKVYMDFADRHGWVKGDATCVQTAAKILY